MQTTDSEQREGQSNMPNQDAGIQSPEIVIAGAGIGGLAAAIALQQRDFDVSVYERGAEVRGLSGSGLTIWGNAMTALARLGLADRLRRLGSSLERQVARTSAGNLLSDAPVGQIQASVGEVGIGIRRHDLLMTLLEAAGPSTVRFCRPVVGFRQAHQDQLGGEGVRVVLDGGEQITARVLIGADGLRSSVREELLHDGPPSALHHMVWRGISDSAGSFPEETSMMVYGPGAVRMVGWPVDRAGHVCWSIGRNGTPQRVRQPPASIKAELEQVIAPFPEPCRHILADTPDERIIRTDLFARTELNQMVGGRVALLGDAAHAMPTVFGQGAAMAIEDAVVLADALAGQRDDLPGGLRDYERRRLPRLRWVRSQVFKVSSFQEWESPLLCAMRDGFFKAMSSSGSDGMWRQLMTFADGSEAPGAPRAETIGLARAR